MFIIYTLVGFVSSFTCCRVALLNRPYPITSGLGLGLNELNCSFLNKSGKGCEIELFCCELHSQNQGNILCTKSKNSNRLGAQFRS